MAWTFGDGFDLYATVVDISSGYWDSGPPVGGSNTLVAGRFAGSQAYSLNASAASPLVKSSGANDAVHHIVCAFRQTATLSGTTLGAYFQLTDNVTNQVCIVFRSDGAILLTSATPGGTVLDTYTGAVSAANTWFAFEFEVVINNTTGSWAVRKNGNTSNDRALGSLNTRPGANAYANKLSFAMSATVASQQIDDILWRSDASSVPWVGDIRCYTRMPASDASAQFSKVVTNILSVAGGTSTADATGTSRYSQFTTTVAGTIGTATVNFSAGFTGNCKLSLFADSAGNPGAVLGSATTLVNPASGANTFTFGTPVSVAAAAPYWFGISHDVTASPNVSTVSVAIGRTSSTVAYAAFPTASPTVGGNAQNAQGSVIVTPTYNANAVNEAQQDGTTSYVYDSAPGHADFYGIAPIASTPVATIAVTTRGFMEKSDAGARTAAVQLKSGGATVSSSTTALASSSWGWVWRTDLTDPNTSAAWTAAAVNNVTIGPTVVA